MRNLSQRVEQRARGSHQDPPFGVRRCEKGELNSRSEANRSNGNLPAQKIASLVKCKVLVQREYNEKLKEYDEWLEKKGKELDSTCKGGINISIFELPSSHMFAGRFEVKESVPSGYGLNSIKAGDILVKVKGEEVKGLRQREVLNLLKVGAAMPIPTALLYRNLKPCRRGIPSPRSSFSFTKRAKTAAATRRCKSPPCASPSERVVAKVRRSCARTEAARQPPRLDGRARGPWDGDGPQPPPAPPAPSPERRPCPSRAAGLLCRAAASASDRPAALRSARHAPRPPFLRRHGK